MYYVMYFIYIHIFYIHIHIYMYVEIVYKFMHYIKYYVL